MAKTEITNYKFDDIIFTSSFGCDSGPQNCKGGCCISGAYIDVIERDKIYEKKELIIENMDETQTSNINEWFEEEMEDQDYISGKCVGTKVYNDKCVFLDKRKWCTLQFISNKLGNHKWDLKPFYCIFFPLTIVDNVITYDDYKHGLEECCTTKEGPGNPIFVSCKEEIEYLFGENGFLFLQDTYSKRKNELLNSSLESK